MSDTPYLDSIRWQGTPMNEAGINLSKDFNSDCGVCRFWDRADETMGRCLRHAPSPAAFSEVGTLLASWPRTHATDVCGDFAFEVEP